MIWCHKLEFVTFEISVVSILKTPGGNWNFTIQIHIWCVSHDCTFEFGHAGAECGVGGTRRVMRWPIARKSDGPRTQAVSSKEVGGIADDTS